MKKNNLVVKSNELNQFTFYKSTIQLKMFSKVILEIRKDKNKKIYRIFINDFFSDFKGSKENYSYLKKSCQKMGQMINIPKEKGFSLKALFYEINTDEKGYIDFEVNPNLKDYILDVTSYFMTYYYDNIINLNSNYSFRIYELLKQYQNKTSLDGWYKVEVEILRDILEIDKKLYPKYSNFKNKVLNVAQKELAEKTDICFRLEEDKRGTRKIQVLIFHIKPNQKIITILEEKKAKGELLFSELNQKTQELKQDTKTKQNKQENLKNTEIYNFLIKEFNLDDAFITEIFGKYDKDRLKRNFDYVAKKIKNNEIKSNIGGFLRKALQGDFANQKSLDDMKQEKREAVKQKEIKEQQDQETIEKLKKLYDENNTNKLYKFLSKNKLDLEQELNYCLEHKIIPSFFIKDIKAIIQKDYKQAIQDIKEKTAGILFKVYLYKHIKIKTFEEFSKAKGYILAKEKGITGQDQYIIQEKITKEKPNNIFFKT